MFANSQSHGLITGGSSGIGFGLAARFADAGATVLVSGRDAGTSTPTIAAHSRRRHRCSGRQGSACSIRRGDDAGVGRRHQQCRDSATRFVGGGSCPLERTPNGNRYPAGGASTPQRPVDPGHAVQRKARPDRQRHVQRRLFPAAVRADPCRLQSRAPQLYDHSSTRVARHGFARRRTHPPQSRRDWPAPVQTTAHRTTSFATRSSRRSSPETYPRWVSG